MGGAVRSASLTFRGRTWLKRLHRELARRHVYRVAVGYVVLAAGTIQLADVVSPALQLPDGTVTILIVACAVGLPIVLLLAWIFEIRLDERGITAPGDVEGAAAEPLASSAAATTPYRIDNLPEQATPFVGRQAELAAMEALEHGGARLITLVAPGGLGKTRLALEFAARARSRFAGGTCMVPLRGISRPELLTAAVRRALGLPEGGSEDAGVGLLEFLRQKRLLLVLDSCDPACGPGPLLTGIMGEAPGVLVVLTSREPLGVEGETLVPVQGLSLRGEGEDPDAVRLFLSRAERVRASFHPDAAELAAIRRICAAVQGIPLALELAAAWTRILPCEEIAREVSRGLEFLDTARHPGEGRGLTLRDVFESTWTYMDDAERRAFSRLAVFRGGFTREAAAEVAGAHAGVLLQLADHAVLRVVGSRFSVMEVLRQYAEERLQEDGPAAAAVRGEHARHFVGLLTAVEERAGTPAAEAALDAVEADHANVRHAWQWLADTGDSPAIEAGLEGLFLFYKGRGRLQEGEEAFAVALTALRRAARGSPPPHAAEALRRLTDRVLIRHGVFCAEMGLYRTAREELGTILRGRRPLVADEETALALHTLGRIAFHTGDYGVAGARAEQALELYRRLGDASGAANALTGLGNCEWAVGETGRAAELYGEAVEAARGAGDRLAQLAPLCNLGVLAAQDGRYGDAIQRFEDALAIARSVGNRQMEANLLTNLARATLDAGDPARAETLVQECSTLCTEMGLRRFLPFCWSMLGVVRARGGDPEAARTLHLRALEVAAALGETPLTLEILRELAAVTWSADRDAARAAEICGVVEASPAADDRLRQQAGALLEAIGAAADAELVEAAAARGRLADPDEVVRRLLASGAPAGAPA